jgi:hypothetical protein
MNAAHLHLVFTHLPIVGLGFVILLNLFSLYQKSIELRKTTLWFYAILGVFALFAYITGDGAAEMMKTYPGITEELIEPHENIALIFFIGLMITTGVSVIGLFITRTKEKLLKKFILYLLILSILVGFLAIMTGISGGNIRHSEIKQGNYKKI